MKRLRRCLSADSRRSCSAPLLHVRKLTSNEMKKATDRFSMIMGSDSDGALYRARFPDGLIAAVKKVKDEEQGKVTFHTDVQYLARLHHRHVVKLVGFSEGPERCLVFEHMENGSLRDWLHDPLKTPLNWRTRLQIAIDVAAALEYIYYFCDPPVYHVTINSNNVMLDNNFVAKVSNVGILDCNCSNNSDLIDNQPRGKLNQRNRDTVFQFGVLILELITGQSMGDEDEPLRWIQGSGFAYSMHKMVDADLGGNYDSRELKSLLIIARLCTKADEESIISIPQILRYLQGKIDPTH
ncbi:probable receptor-like protein kinase At1g49730 [Dendrobium catenatum]|uniref:Putative receptor-like protein kinase n=1 Tax=Dendrobium catenatum TaxID=906689 RepID=A0A2I0X0D5_9ASPA|nr:probable receptor-like protein kinase At1g49730 [Dendrobium catenatum]PKU81374.1 putative receptor-like protein kinase [Dendrobium catenatum]